MTLQQIEDHLGIDLAQPSILVAYHPVTLLANTVAEADALFDALAALPQQLLFCYPNADAGSRSLIDRTSSFLRHRGTGRLFVNLPALQYWSLLKHVQLMVGNSSSGIMETASFALPTVNVGLRQKGRERPRNVLDTAPSPDDILKAISKAQSSIFAESIAGMTNPYGDGHAAERIVRVLISLPSRNGLLMKRSSETLT